ncbi:uncharacterized protein F5891DRAFT_1191361 [Suillus fuscotomentosus]|uniref:GPI-anchored wall transfer protein 1 n=1 Tax=Suillus fuscotomentosus TaxID=1912939 RepID=A0AAD4E1L0_9AGAM|nr:uncharacterized protein F5891DRAFT_1191361 [Suillus fuscotomentosus]KAG1898060.1 hypothetical protein F5891DRAFT_1191361 [Suillus fuscotomentosus]
MEEVEQTLHRRTHLNPSDPYLLTTRAHMMLMTILCILVVDFPVFPSILEKCETYGVSLMDIGVGSFVFSQGVVSVIPIIKDMSYLQAPILPKLKSVSRNMIPIIVLGILRVVLTKGTEHVTEYGVHWNFFLTLALLPIIEVLLHPIILRIPLLCWVFGLDFCINSHCHIWRNEGLFTQRFTEQHYFCEQRGLAVLTGYNSLLL